MRKKVFILSVALLTAIVCAMPLAAASRVNAEVVPVTKTGQWVTKHNDDFNDNTQVWQQSIFWANDALIVSGDTAIQGKSIQMKGAVTSGAGAGGTVMAGKQELFPSNTKIRIGFDFYATNASLLNFATGASGYTSLQVKDMQTATPSVACEGNALAEKCSIERKGNYFSVSFELEKADVVREFGIYLTRVADGEYSVVLDNFKVEHWEERSEHAVELYREEFEQASGSVDENTVFFDSVYTNQAGKAIDGQSILATKSIGTSDVETVAINGVTGGRRLRVSLALRSSLWIKVSVMNPQTKNQFGAVLYWSEASCIEPSTTANMENVSFESKDGVFYMTFDFDCVEEGFYLEITNGGAGIELVVDNFMIYDVGAQPIFQGNEKPLFNPAAAADWLIEGVNTRGFDLKSVTIGGKPLNNCSFNAQDKVLTISGEELMALIENGDLTLDRTVSLQLATNGGICAFEVFLSDVKPVPNVEQVDFKGSQDVIVTYQMLSGEFVSATLDGRVLQSEEYEIVEDAVKDTVALTVFKEYLNTLSLTPNQEMELIFVTNMGEASVTVTAKKTPVLGAESVIVDLFAEQNLAVNVNLFGYSLNAVSVFRDGNFSELNSNLYEMEEGVWLVDFQNIIYIGSSVGTYRLRFETDAGSCEIQLEIIRSAAISTVSSAKFDKANQKDVVLPLDSYGLDVSKIEIGQTQLAETDYFFNISIRTLTLYKEALKALALGEYSLKITTTNALTITFSIVDTTPVIVTEKAEFSGEDVKLTVDLSGKPLVAVYIGEVALARENYTLSGNELIIKKKAFLEVKQGEQQLKLVTESGESMILVEVKGDEPSDSGKTIKIWSIIILSVLGAAALAMITLSIVKKTRGKGEQQ